MLRFTSRSSVALRSRSEVASGCSRLQVSCRALQATSHQFRVPRRLLVSTSETTPRFNIACSNPRYVIRSTPIQELTLNVHPRLRIPASHNTATAAISRNPSIEGSMVHHEQQTSDSSFAIINSHVTSQKRQVTQTPSGLL